MQVLWIIGATDEALYAVRLADVLEQKYGFHITFVTPFDSTRKALGLVNRDVITLAELLAEVEGELPASEAEVVAEANHLLQTIDLNMLVHGDPILYTSIDRQTARLFIARATFAFHKLLREGAFSLCLRYGGGDAVGRIPQILGETMGLNTFTLSHASLLNNCGLRPSGVAEHWTWRSFPEVWEQQADRKFSATEKRALDERIHAYYESHRKAPRTRLDQLGVGPTKNPLVVLKRTVKFMLLQVRSMLKQRDTFSASQRAALLLQGKLEVLLPTWERFVSRNTSKLLRTYLTFKYDPVPEAGKYIYLPLNQPFDAPNRFWYPMNYLQQNLARVVAESLPTGYELVIKEHPYTYGEVDHAQLRELQMRGVRIVKPQEHSLELIRNAAAVFCVGDASGWEGLMLQTPVIVFGAHPFYTSYPHVWQVFDPNEVHHVLRQAVQKGRAVYEDADLWYAFIHSAFDSAYAGNVWAYKAYIWTPLDASDENVQLVATMIAEESRKALPSAAPLASERAL